MGEERSGAGKIVHERPPGGGRVLALTGAQTFLGRNLVGALEDDPSAARVIVTDTVNAGTAGAKTTYYSLDRTQPDASVRLAEILAAEKVDCFVHLGFLEMPTAQTGWAHELESVGTLHVLNACRECGVHKLVLGSSTLLYGPHADNPNFLSEEHPLRGLRGAPFLRDKIDAERQVAAFAAERPGAEVTVLRFAPLLGPTVRNLATDWLARSWVPLMMGFDPLMQFVHEADAVAALLLAVRSDVSGTFNIAGDGVLPVSMATRLAGRSPLPIPHMLAKRLTALLWMAGMSPVPPAFLRFLVHLCVADAARARTVLGFEPTYTTREAVLEFGSTLRLREAKLLTEAHA